MNPIRQSIWFLLTHSIITLVAILTLTAVFAVFQIALSIAELGSGRSFQTALMVNLTIATFLGIYLGGALLKLKQNYLWRINQRYRSSLIAAFLIIIGTFNLIQLPLFYFNVNDSYLVLLAPFCIAIFSSHLVLGKNLLQKALIPAIPYLIAQLHRIDVSSNIMMLLVLISTMGLLASMYFDRTYPDSLSRKNTKTNASIAMSAVATGFRPSIITSFNHYIGVGIASWVTSSKKSIDWAVLMPHTKLALPSLFYVLMILTFVLVAGDKDKPLLESLAILFIATSIISIVIESRQLIRQTRFFAHVFSGAKHRQLKNKILFSLDKTFIVNCTVFVTATLLLASSLSMMVNVSFFIYSALAIILIGFAIYPILLCMTWINVSFPQISSVGAYALLIFMATRWLRDNPDNVQSSPYALGFVVGCFLIRAGAQMVFWNRPFEKLLKNT